MFTLSNVDTANADISVIWLKMRKSFPWLWSWMIAFTLSCILNNSNIGKEKSGMTYVTISQRISKFFCLAVVCCLKKTFRYLKIVTCSMNFSPTPSIDGFNNESTQISVPLSTLSLCCRVEAVRLTVRWSSISSLAIDLNQFCVGCLQPCFQRLDPPKVQHLKWDEVCWAGTQFLSDSTSTTNRIHLPICCNINSKC